MEGASFFMASSWEVFYSAQADSRPLRDSRPSRLLGKGATRWRGTDSSRAVFSERFVVDLGEIEIRIGIRFLLLVLVADGDDAEDAIVLRDAKLLPESLFGRPAVAFAPPKLDPCGTEPEFLRLKLDEDGYDGGVLHPYVGFLAVGDHDNGERGGSERCGAVLFVGF